MIIMENEAKKFREGLKVNSKYLEKKIREPSLKEKIDGYHEFIATLGGGFMNTVEQYIKAIQIATKNELIGEVKLKARIKDFSSSDINTEIKELDDVFGIEVSTATEFEKEILILFNQLIFDINKDKKYNKENGYRAYHCMGDLDSNKFTQENIREGIINLINNSKTKVYKKSNDKGKTKNNENIFSELKNITQNSNKMNEVVSVLTKMVNHMQNYENGRKFSRENTPIMEFHFLTSEVAENAIRGSASHASYKNTNETLIRRYFEEGKLIEGINIPLKFYVSINNNNECKLKLQEFDEIVLDKWPFLKSDIVKKRNNEENKKGSKKKYTNHNSLNAYVYKFLEPYIKNQRKIVPGKEYEALKRFKKLVGDNVIDPNSKYDQKSEEESWLDDLFIKD